jgi:hypothetical protein
MKIVATGTAYLLRQNLEVPFTLERRVGAACFLGNIRYDKESRAVIGMVEDPAIHLGNNLVVWLLEEVARYVLDQQAHKLAPCDLRDQIEASWRRPADHSREGRASTTSTSGHGGGVRSRCASG